MLLIMDMMNDLVSPEGPNAKTYGVICAERGVLTKAGDVLDRARRKGIAVGFVRVGFSPDYREWPPKSPIFAKAKEFGLFKLGTWGTEVIDELKPREGEHDIVKHRVSPFYGTALEPILRARGIGELYLCGVSTNGVVSAGVREGHDRDYAITVIEDCCAGATPEEHEHAISGLRRYAKLVQAEQVQF